MASPDTCDSCSSSSFAIDVQSPKDNEQPNDARRVLSTLSMVGVTYFAVCGGPIGSEGLMAEGGPLLGLIGIVVFPIVWCLPMASMTAELSTTFPHDGGYTVWVLHAFGPYWAFQTGYWSWLAGVVDNALYPELILTAITQTYGPIHSAVHTYLIKAGITIALSIPSFLGVSLVGRSMVILSIVVLLPFVVLSAWGVATGSDWTALGEIRRSETVTSADGTVIGMTGEIDINWFSLLNIFFWNFSGATAISLFGGEVANPSRTYPIAIGLFIVLMSITYATTLLGAVVYDHPHWSTWKEGSFMNIAESIGGHFMATWALVGAVGSNAGIFMADLFCDSFELYGMAECGLVPAFLTARSKRFDTPHNGILCSLVIILVLISFPFQQIVKMSNALTGFYTFAIIFAFLRLRLNQPHLERPFKAPGGKLFVVSMCVPPLGILVLITVSVLWNLTTALMVVPIVVVGLLIAGCSTFTSSQFDSLRTSL